MSTVPNVPVVPVNPAKGNLQGQTTLAAKIDRWRGLNNNLEPQIDLLPQFKEQFAKFQSLLSQAQALRDRMKIIQGDANEAIQQRNFVFAAGDELFTRLSHALKAVHGPESGRLRDFGIKPRKQGRPKKKATDPVPPAAPEVSTAPPLAGGAHETPAAAAPTLPKE
ncbi:MAG TPA: hypothetical protein VFE33_19700 [Thermoanaerobaculia bacterium]|nr:hypothetical protein [Thermoanaerobaculia bacterium]